MYTVHHGVVAAVDAPTVEDVLNILEKELRAGYSNILVVRKGTVVEGRTEHSVDVTTEAPVRIPADGRIGTNVMTIAIHAIQPE